MNLEPGTCIELPKGWTLNFSGSPELCFSGGIAAKVEGELKKFSGLAYSGGLLKIPGKPVPYVVELSGIQATDKPRPILKDHLQSLIVGHSSSLTINASGLHVEGAISGAGPIAQEVVTSSQAGFPWQLSIGVDPVGTPVFVPKGKSIQANGRTFAGPLIHVPQSTLKEISFVALGADDDTSARIAASAQEIHMNFEDFVKAQGLDINTISASLKATLQASYDAQQKGDDPPDPVATEEARIAEIQRICANGHSEIQATAIRDAWDVNRTKIAVLRAGRPNVGTIRRDGPNAEIRAQATSAALCFSVGLPEDKIGKWYPEQAVDMATGKDYRSLGIQAVLYQTIQAAGMHITPGVFDSDTIRAAFEADAMLKAAGHSTIGGLNIFDNVLHKSMLNQYESVPSIIPFIAREREVPDLRKVNSYRVTGMGRLQRLGKNGEIENVWLKDEKFENQAHLTAAIITLSEEDMLNDDLHALTSVPEFLGRMAAQTREDIAWDMFLSNPGSFFSAGNGNYFHGADSVLSIDSLSKAEQIFDELEDDDGKPLRLQPHSLLVAPKNKVKAQSLMKETRVVGPADAQTLADNPHAGKWVPLSEPALKGEPDTWYLAANPAITAAIELVYLRGRRQPTIERGDVNFNQLGASWRCVWGLGANMADHRAMVKALGGTE